MMVMQPEELLIRQCLMGNRDALDQLYLQYSSKMYAICLRYSYDKIEAEDLLQDGFIKVYSQLSKFKGKGSFEGWMRRIFVNLSIDYYHKKTKENFNKEELKTLTQDDHDDNVWPAINEKEIIELIQQLPDGYRMVFNLFAIELYSHKEIASMLGVSESTSKTQFFKARKMLQAKVNAIVSLREEKI